MEDVLKISHTAADVRVRDALVQVQCDGVHGLYVLAGAGSIRTQRIEANGLTVFGIAGAVLC